MALETTENAVQETESKTAQKKLKPVQPKEAEEYGQFVYIGPSLPRGRLKQNFIMNGTRSEIRDWLADVLEDYPQVMRLIVPAARLAESVQRAEKSGHILHKYYNDIISAMAAKREG